VNNKLSRLKEVLWIVAMFGLVAIIARIFGGLGASTNLSDSMPWGLWKILNMVAGAALATGGFTLALIVHIFKIEKYKPLMRPAILIAFLGYGSSLFALLWDIGLPHVFYSPFFNWNHHSFLFEVFWCVSLYFTVTALELAPIIFEQYRAEKIVTWLHRISTPIIILGITFSTLHHTSLGSLFLVMPTRLHELWFTSWIPVLFILSAIGAGMMMVVFVRLAYSYFFDKKENMTVVSGLSRIAAGVLGIYFIVKIADLVYHGKVGLLFSGQWESYVFVAELLLSVIIPIIIVAIPRFRSSKRSLVCASGSAVLGLAMNRVDVGIIGLIRTSETAYFPSFLEFSLSFGVIAAALLVMIYVVENFQVMPELPEKLSQNVGIRPRTDKISEMWARSFLNDRARISLLVVVSIPLAASIFYSGINGGVALNTVPIHAPRGLDKMRTVLVINGDLDENYVKFQHEMHKQKLGGEESCVKCHHLDLPNDNATTCFKCHTDMNQKVSIFDHAFHEKEKGGKSSCTECHDTEKAKNLDNSKACAECHVEDMNNFPAMGQPFNHMALSYMDAMHDRCITCHKEQEILLNRPGMSDCAHCHQEAWQKEFVQYEQVLKTYNDDFGGSKLSLKEVQHNDCNQN